jgi:hypothetical protein
MQAAGGITRLGDRFVTHMGDPGVIYTGVAADR